MRQQVRRTDDVPNGQLAPVLQYLRRVSGAAEDDDDRALLERFARQRDGDAFALLVRRHGPMVLAVCRRVLHNSHDADDAFQAVFLLLLRKAGSLRRPEQLGPWLHGVAQRVALKARALGLRRRARQEPLLDPPAPPAADELVWRDLRPVLDDAVRSLPAKYRTPFILCYLQGMTHAEAARRLGCPPGTVATRLSRARAQLRTRLVRRGVTLSVAASAAALAGATEASVPPALVAGLVGAAASSGTVPLHVTALTEGVCQAMLMEKLRFVVLGLVAAVAVGALVMGYRSGAAEPVGVPQVVAPPAPAPVAPAPPPPDKDAAAVTVSSKNFAVTAPNRRVAALCLGAAERCRQEVALLWLGKELPDWPERCPVRVQITMSGTGAATVFEFGDGKVKRRDMHLEGPLDRLLTSALPHEVTHTIFADYFGQPVPRWADEGGAVLSEDEEERQRHDKLTHGIVETPGRAIALRRLLAMKDFPADVMVLYAEGYSVTRFLVEKKNRKTFLAFVKQGMSDGWDKAAKEQYGFRDVEALEDAWLAAVRRKPEPLATPNPAARVKGEDGLDIPTGSPPATGLAVVGKKKAVLRVIDVSYAYVPVQRPVKPDGKGGEGFVTEYVARAQGVERILDLADAPVYDMKGRRIDPTQLPDLLRKPTPVLIARDGKMVDPFHLRLIKEGTLIIVPPVTPAREALPPPPAPVAPAAPPVPSVPQP
jgi:RNA polymerase sigma factor (sigma-70 family)